MSWDLSRRVFLRGAGLAAVGIGFAPSTLMVRAARAATLAGRTLVQVFLRGGCDGLNLCVPYTDPEYPGIRGAIALTRGQVVDLDGHFGLNPSLAALKALWDEGRLAFTHAVGSYAL